MADEYCEKWVQKLRTRFGDACYGFEDTTLAQAALDALLKSAACLLRRTKPLAACWATPCAACSTAKQRSIWQPDLPEPGERPPHCRAGSSAQKVPRRYGSGRCRPRSKRFAAGQCGLCRRVYARNSGAGAFCAAVQPHRRGSLCPEPRNLRYGNRQPYSGLGPPPCIGDAPGTFRYYLQAGAGAPAVAGQRRRPAEARFPLYAAPQGCPGQTGG